MAWPVRRVQWSLRLCRWRWRRRWGWRSSLALRLHRRHTTARFTTRWRWQGQARYGSNLPISNVGQTKEAEGDVLLLFPNSHLTECDAVYFGIALPAFRSEISGSIFKTNAYCWLLCLTVWLLPWRWRQWILPKDKSSCRRLHANNKTTFFKEE
jgi:hypothetical protein